MSYIDSQNISVYPTYKRDDKYDRNARLNSEQNLISTVNRLTGTDAFVIDGLNINVDTSANKVYLTSGSCNIHGYYFTIQKVAQSDNGTSSYIKDSATAFPITSFNIDDNIGKTLYFEIETQEVIANSNNSTVVFTELVGNDIMESGISKYSGINLVMAAEMGYENGAVDEVTGYHKYYLPIAKMVAKNVWEPAKNRTLKYTAEDVLVSFDNSADGAPIDGKTWDTAYAGETSLAYWLRANYIIDDGNL